MYRVPVSVGDPPVRQVELWSLREDVALRLEDDRAVLQTPWGVTVLPNLGAMAREVLRRMTFGPVSLDNAMAFRLKDAEQGSESEAAEVREEERQLQAVLGKLCGLVVRSLALEDSEPPLLSVVPMTRRARFELPPEDLPAARLSRFTTLHAENGELILESALSLHRVVLHRPDTAWLVSSLSRPSTAGDLAKPLGLSEAAANQVLRYLAASGMVVLSDGVRKPLTAASIEAEPQFTFAEDSDPVLASWSGRDLLFHARSRGGRHDEPYGATYPYLGRMTPPPLLKTVPEGPRTPLPRPSFDDLRIDDMTLTSALEKRQSIRSYSDRPMAVEQIGELLYRSARVRSMFLAATNGRQVPISTTRPYPSGGSSYALEIYVTVGHGEGVERGIHYYDPFDHALVLVNRDEDAVRELLEGAKRVADAEGVPPVLLTMTARFSRVSWKYSGMWYAAILKEVGVLQQTLYLVSTAMGLAPCALMGGDSDAAARAFGLDWRVESSVGEFVVGPSPEANSLTSDYPAAGNETALVVQPINDPDWAQSDRGFQELDV